MFYIVSLRALKRFLLYAPLCQECERVCIFLYKIINAENRLGN